MFNLNVLLKTSGAFMASKGFRQEENQNRISSATLVESQKKGRRTMSHSPSANPARPAGGYTEQRKAAYLTYQAVTIAAMLLLLVSLWVF